MRLHAAAPAARIVRVGAERARPAPGVLEAIAGGRRGPVPAVQPGGQHRHHPGGARHPGGGRAPGPWSGVSPIIGGAPVRGMADAVPGRDRRRDLGRRGRRALRRRAARRLAGRRPDEAAADDPALAGIAVRALPLLMSDLPATTAIARRRARPGPGAEPMTGPRRWPGRSRRARRPAGLRRCTGSRLAVTGLPEVAAGDDLAALIAAARPGPARRRRPGGHLQDRQQGRGPGGHRRRPGAGHRRRDGAGGGPARAPPGSWRPGTAWSWPRPGSTPPTPPPAPSCCCPRTPTRRPGGCATALRDALGVDVGVIVTDTFGRPWRTGLTDVAIGAAGLRRSWTTSRGDTDTHGNTLSVTVVAIADELAAAGDLVKGKAPALPVARACAAWPQLVTEPDGPGRARPWCSGGRRGHVPVRLGRTCRWPAGRIRDFTAEPVDGAAVRRAVAAASPRPRRTTRRRGGSCCWRRPRPGRGCSTPCARPGPPTCAATGSRQE